MAAWRYGISLQVMKFRISARSCNILYLNIITDPKLKWLDFIFLFVSGGPLVCEEKDSWILRGVTSWGHEKCKTDHYSVYTRVSFYISWIENQIASESRH